MANVCTCRVTSSSGSLTYGKNVFSLHVSVYVSCQWDMPCYFTEIKVIVLKVTSVNRDSRIFIWHGLLYPGDTSVINAVCCTLFPNNIEKSTC